MTTKELQPGKRYWCWWKSRYLWYDGIDYNARDHVFLDAADCRIILGAKEIAELEEKSRRN